METEPIAIIGTACRFAGSSSSPSKLWELLSKPKDVASEPPSHLFNIDGYYHPQGTNHGTTNTRESYFLTEDVRKFDAPFFKIPTSEANAIDPQQRLLLETVYESLESAGLPLESLQGSPTGVFCGIMTGDWEQLLGVDGMLTPQYASTGIARNNLANRVSYFFDWHGPSMSVDTACSSSLVALHLAVTALNQGECKIAAALGVNIILSPFMYIGASKMGMLSPNGRSRMWDAEADGYARGEGVASVIMKRLSDAVADGDIVECVIRGTGVNQDGQTMGLTMPSSTAQFKLIRSTYAKAGLDPVTRPEDRCQYFEAHGTGTQAGDPEEASAIYQAFFGPDCQNSPGNMLQVGSVKTVIGHTEGTAGLAGVIKASLSIQHGIIPPNLHFNRLNPKLEPFASRLKIPMEVTPWPQLPQGVPRRVSVNSFGFGGTNSHAILESYDPSVHRKPLPGDKVEDTPVVLPFTFSAASERTLGALLQKYQEYLESSPSVEPNDLAWSLLKKRSALMYRLTFSAPTISTLRDQIEEELLLRKANKSSTIISRQKSQTKRILGVFTGQGAQWPQMGLDLVAATPQARVWFEELQSSLDDLPIEHRPDFSLLEELSAPASSSRLHEAALSQPLCTAVQIVFINFLSAVGVSLDVVVGHSSGEIGAAYAAGLLTARDAIRIAYLRGHLAHLAKPQGSMLAAGLSMEEATEFCAQSQFDGRITVAASNSPSSVTLSGNTDAILEAEQLLKTGGKFARPLRVDKAYHSHHMEPCTFPYGRALEECNIKLGASNSAIWYSSVYPGQDMGQSGDGTALAGEYWVDNMVKPVLFSQALSTAIMAGGSPPDLIVEVGPHPALKGPVLQTIADAFPGAADTPYIGVSNRGGNGVEAFANAIGLLWAHLGADAINTERYFKLFNQEKKLSFVKDLPSYPFDHSQVYKFEPRKVKARLQRPVPNPLLGCLSEETAEREFRWRNILRRDVLEWLDGHQIQGQTIFPATGYIAMALEAARFITGEKAMRLIQITDFNIIQAIPFNDADTTGVETIVRVDHIKSEGDTTTATFTCDADIGGSLKTCASGQLRVTMGEPDPNLLPRWDASSCKLARVEIGEFYSSLEKLGYGYTGPFRGITAIDRKLDAARGLMNNVRSENSSLLLHPAVMDTALQTLLGAIGAPGDGQLPSLYVPTKIETTTVNPAFCSQIGRTSCGDKLRFDAYLTNPSSQDMSGDVDMFTLAGEGLLQFEGVRVSPLTRPVPIDDAPTFGKLVWSPLRPDARITHVPISPEWLSNVEGQERAIFIYLTQLMEQLTDEDRANLDWHRSRIVDWIDHIMEQTRAGKHRVCRPEWFGENEENPVAIMRRLLGPRIADYMEAIGENLLGFLRNEKNTATMLEILTSTGLLTSIYKDEVETRHQNGRLADLVKQISLRYPRLKILEIGGGTGSATREIITRIGRSYHSYVFTDISAGFFDSAQEEFGDHSDRFVYQVLDIMQDPQEQGFEEHSYDLVVAANVLHATRYLEATMRRVRRILKPGGYLVALENMNRDVLRTPFSVCVFEGWWLGEQDGRIRGPLLPKTGWDDLLRRTGFSGIDTITPQEHPHLTSSAAFVSQAVDDRISLLNDPLSFTPQEPGELGSGQPHKYDDLILVGGASERTSGVVLELEALLRPYFCRIIRSTTIQCLDLQDSYLATVIVLADIDSPVFQDMTESKMSALKRLEEATRKLLWVTVGCEEDHPLLGLSKGFLNCMNYEYQHSTQQYLNIVDANDLKAPFLATMLMRLAHTDSDNDYALSTSVGSTEWELRLEDGILKIPRVVAEHSVNERYISGLREMYKYVDPQRSIIEVAESCDGHRIFLEREAVANSEPASVEIRVRYSTLAAFHVSGAGYLTLVSGSDTRTNRRLFALSSRHASVVAVPSSWCWELPANIPEDDVVGLLKGAASVLLASALVQQANAGTSLLVHEAEDMLRRAVWIKAMSAGIQPHFSSSQSFEGPTVPSTLFLHERSSLRALARKVPANLAAAANFDSKADGVFSRLEPLFTRDVTRINIHKLYRPSPSLSEDCDLRRVVEALNQARILGSQLAEQIQPNNVVNVEQLPGHLVKDDIFAIADWTQTHQLPVQLRPASLDVFLSANKTYLLIGMTGDLGRSVASWLVTRGARNIVLTSRNPEVDDEWIKEMARSGARVAYMTMDVTDRESILRVDGAMRQSYPPVGGVVNGAMVLQDQMFADMTLEGMHSQFRPKVQGSILVEEIYGGMDLDFFILFGSATGISGNWGQSAYAAATNFMTNMIRARRKKRLVGSILYPSEIRGIGYFMRRDSGLSQLMNNTIGRAFLSERGLHEMFAEAILAGRPDSGLCPEIMITPRLASPLELPNILWYRNPKLWEFIDYSMQSTSSQTAGQAVSIKEQLQSATSMCEAVNVIAEGFGAKLTHKLHLSAEIPVTPATRLSELGVDSLVAVDLRTWFVKELEVDIPMLRILGGSSIGELAEEAASKLSPDMLPRIERGQDQQQAADIKQGQEPQSPRESATVSTGTESDWYRDFTPQTRSDDEESGSAS